MTATFGYHAGGQLAAATHGDKTESFLWDGLALIRRDGTEYVNEPHAGGGAPVLAGDKVLFNDMLGSTLGAMGTDGFKTVARTAFGETGGNSAEEFFTGKPMVGDLGYAFLFRAYRPGLGKWQTADPLGYPDGWNNLAYCNSRVTDCVDWLGALVQAVFSITKHTLTITDLDTKQKIVVTAFSGDSDPDHQWLPDVGPLPFGLYDIVNDKSRLDWFDLYRYDDVWNDWTIGPNGVVRGQFRLHVGTISLGCVTITDPNGNDVISLIQATSYQSAWDSNGDIRHIFGTLRVVE